MEANLGYDAFAELLNLKNVKAADVARATGVSNTTLSDWKRGKSRPKQDKIFAIAKYFGVDPAAFSVKFDASDITQSILKYMEDSVQLNGHKEGYYINEETAQIAQEIFEDKDLRALFDAGRNASPRDLQIAADLLRKLKATNPDG